MTPFQKLNILMDAVIFGAENRLITQLILAEDPSAIGSI